MHCTGLFDANAACWNAGSRSNKNTLCMVQEHCQSTGILHNLEARLHFRKKNASFRGKLHNLRGYCFLTKKHSIFLKEKCSKWIKDASLQEGNAPLMHWLLHFRTGMQNVNTMLHILHEGVLFQGMPYHSKKTCVCVRVFERKVVLLKIRTASSKNAWCFEGVMEGLLAQPFQGF